MTEAEVKAFVNAWGQAAIDRGSADERDFRAEFQKTFGSPGSFTVSLLFRNIRVPVLEQAMKDRYGAMQSWGEDGSRVVRGMVPAPLVEKLVERLRKTTTLPPIPASAMRAYFED